MKLLMILFNPFFSKVPVRLRQAARAPDLIFLPVCKMLIFKPKEKKFKKSGKKW